MVVHNVQHLVLSADSVQNILSLCVRSTTREAKRIEKVGSSGPQRRIAESNRGIVYDSTGEKHALLKPVASVEDIKGLDCRLVAAGGKATATATKTAAGQKGSDHLFEGRALSRPPC